jgi:predicted PurR-regulated permease PerM
VLAGVLEVVPRLGPVLSVVPAAALAVVHPSATMPGLPAAWFVLVVVLLYIGIQQVENNILVPRILGESVNLPPAVVLLGTLAGAKLAGVAGILLAAPILGTLRVIGSWLSHQLARPSPPMEVEVEAAAEGAAGAGTAAEGAWRSPAEGV